MNHNKINWRPTVRLAIETAWRYRLRVLAATSLVAVTASIQTLTMKPPYQAEARVLIETGRESAVRIDLGGSPSHFSRDTERLIRNELQILRSRELARQFLAVPSEHEIYPDLELLPADRRLTLAVDRFLEALRVRAYEGTDTINIAFTHQDPTIAQASLEGFIEVFRQRHLEIYSDTELLEFLEGQVDTSTRALENVEEDLKVFRLSSGSHSSEDSEGLISRQQLDLDRELKAATKNVAALKKKVESLLIQKNGIRKQVHLFAEEDPTIAEARRDLLALRLEEKDLLGTYKEGNRQVTNLRNKIAVIEAFLAENAGKRTSRTGHNSVLDDVEKNLIRTVSELASEQAAANQLREQFSSVGDEVDLMVEHEGHYRDLLRRRAALETNLINYSTRLDELRISSQMDERGLASITTIDPVALSEESPGPSRRLLLLIGALLSLLAGLAAGFLSDHLSPAIGNKDRVTTALGLPVLVTFERSQRRSA